MKSITGFFRKQHGYFAFIVLLMLPLILENCKRGGTNSPEDEQGMTADTSVVDSLPADFAAFYDRFHTDSQYQIDHIIFPLEGLPNSGLESDTTLPLRFYWQRDNWKLHRHFTDPSGQFEHWFEVNEMGIIEHWVQMKGTNLKMWRRFAKLKDDQWYLIYYVGMRPHEDE